MTNESNNQPNAQIPLDAAPVEANLQLDFAIDLSLADRELLARTLGVQTGELAAAMKPFAKAALREYVEMFTGRTPISTGSEVRELRLLWMILEGPNRQVPGEDMIGRLFQLTPQESQRLIRTTLTRYQHVLSAVNRGRILAAYGKIQQSAPGGDGVREVALNRLDVEQLNAIVATRDPAASRIRLRAGTASTYRIEESALAALQAELEPGQQ